VSSEKKVLQLLQIRKSVILSCINLGIKDNEHSIIKNFVWAFLFVSIEIALEIFFHV